jgi:DNA-binding transcriptional regulator YhcF (GntR family)
MVTDAARLPSPHTPLHELIPSLQRASWGDLDGREFQGLRTTLQALVASVNWRSAEGLATTNQIADRAGLTPRWTRRCLALLEDMGLITWRRGCVVEGKARPSWFRVNKKVLVALIDKARPLREAALRIRREITARRIAGIRFAKRSRRSVHVELSADLPPLTGEVSASPPPQVAGEGGECGHGEPRGPGSCALCRRGLP